jgi:hypothetical protein
VQCGLKIENLFHLSSQKKSNSINLLSLKSADAGFIEISCASLLESFHLEDFFLLGDGLLDFSGVNRLISTVFDC